MRRERSHHRRNAMVLLRVVRRFFEWGLGAQRLTRTVSGAAAGYWKRIEHWQRCSLMAVARTPKFARLSRSPRLLIS